MKQCVYVAPEFAATERPVQATRSPIRDLRRLRAPRQPVGRVRRRWVLCATALGSESRGPRGHVTAAAGAAAPARPPSGGRAAGARGVPDGWAAAPGGPASQASSWLSTWSIVPHPSAPASTALGCLQPGCQHPNRWPPPGSNHRRQAVGGIFESRRALIVLNFAPATRPHRSILPHYPIASFGPWRIAPFAFCTPKFADRPHLRGPISALAPHGREHALLGLLRSSRVRR
jgi:hypothetical protein